ncbi:unnamed protein product [Schistocephalus solidus]|uniref:Uncharacterized protein n=1 Tax=Schistocephalus solidus TaxID=70667 RepID=A0A183TRR3_SCHSO|nr:unnamed protein product [Schistocephalus solidus]
MPSEMLGSNRTERRTALVARERACYKVDIAALSETRFSEQGHLEEVGASYTFWSGRPKAEQRDSGVAFAIRNDIFATIISAYAPPVTRSDVAKDWFADNDADICILLAEKNGLHKACMDLRTDAAPCTSTAMGDAERLDDLKV